MIPKLKILFPAIILVLGIAQIGLAQEKEESKETVVMKTVTGEVSGISKTFIAILYGVDAKNTTSLEMALTVDKDVKIEHRDSLSQIGVGDTVEATYEEKAQKDEKGNIRVLSRIVKKITFLKQAKKIEEATTLKSQEQ